MDLSIYDNSLNYTKDQNVKLKKACDGFEALFLTKMFDTMQESVMDGGLVKKNQGEEIFTQMLHSQVAQDFTKTDGLGLSDMLYDSMSKFLEAEKQSSKGNNFPDEGKNSTASSEFLRLKRELSGTDVASDIAAMN